MTSFKASILICAISINQAHAKMELISTQSEPSLEPYVQINTGKRESFLIKSRYKKTHSEAEFFLYTRELKCNSPKNIKNFKSPPSYLILPPLSNASYHSPLIASVDIEGRWDVLRLHNNLSKILQTIPLNDFSIVLSIATSPGGYFVGGVGKEKFPSIQYFSSDLKRNKLLDSGNNDRGEVSVLLENQGRMLSIVNYYADKERDILPHSVLHAYGTTGDFLARISLNGLAATAISLKNEGLAISYWIGRQLYLERRSQDFATQSKIKLHESQGIASIMGRLIEVEDDIAWIGINDRKLLVHRVNQFSNAVRTSTTTAESGFLPSGVNTPYAHAYGKELHILSTAFRQDSSHADQLTEGGLKLEVQHLNPR